MRKWTPGGKMKLENYSGNSRKKWLIASESQPTRPKRLMLLCLEAAEILLASINILSRQIRLKFAYSCKCLPFILPFTTFLSSLSSLCTSLPQVSPSLSCSPQALKGTVSQDGRGYTIGMNQKVSLNPIAP